MVAEWSKSVAFKAGVSQRRFESGRRQTVRVNACTLWQGSLNLSVTFPMTTSDAETNVKLSIYFIYLLLSFTGQCPGVNNCNSCNANPAQCDTGECDSPGYGYDSSSGGCDGKHLTLRTKTNSCTSSGVATIKVDAMVRIWSH